MDPEARHGHKTAARSFDGYKDHIAVDPESEIVTATKVTPGSAGDASVAEELIEDLRHVGDPTANEEDDIPPRTGGGVRGLGLRKRRVPVLP